MTSRRLPRRSLHLVVLAVLTAVLAACATGTATVPPTARPQTFAPVITPGPTPLAIWPAPSDPLARAVAAGIEPDVREHIDNHVHAHLDVFVDGVPVEVPAGIGIDITNPEVKRFDEPAGVIYGGIEACDTPCLSSLHTHDATGIIHTESPVAEPHTLGEFFIEWGVEVEGGCIAEYCSPETPIAVYLDGEAYTGDINAIELTDLLVIAIVIGTPPDEIPSTADFSKA